MLRVSWRNGMGKFLSKQDFLTTMVSRLRPATGWPVRTSNG